MQKDSKLFDDIARMATGAAGSFLDIRREVESSLSVHLERLIRKMNLVTREEFETVRMMAERARAEQEKLAERLDAFEKKMKSEI